MNGDFISLNMHRESTPISVILKRIILPQAEYNSSKILRDVNRLHSKLSLHTHKSIEILSIRHSEKCAHENFFK